MRYFKTTTSIPWLCFENIMQVINNRPNLTKKLLKIRAYWGTGAIQPTRLDQGVDMLKYFETQTHVIQTYLKFIEYNTTHLFT